MRVEEEERQGRAGGKEINTVKSVMEKFDGVRQRKIYAYHDQSRHE